MNLYSETYSLNLEQVKKKSKPFEPFTPKSLPLGEI